MSKIITILHAPGAGSSQVMTFYLKLRDFIDQIELHFTDLRIFTQPEAGINEIEKEKDVQTLIVGWAVTKKPNLKQWARIILRSQMVTQFIPLDLIDRHGDVASATSVVHDNAGDWGSKTQRTKLKLFLRGFYLNAFAPFGLRLLPKNDRLINQPSYRSCRLLEPGSPDEIEIVRLIFRLFVDHDYCFTEVSNLLNVQKIKPPQNKRSWTPRTVKDILQSTVYIGTNHFRGCIKHDVFSPLIDRSVFFQAQNKIFDKQICLDSIEM